MVTEIRVENLITPEEADMVREMGAEALAENYSEGIRDLKRDLARVLGCSSENIAKFTIDIEGIGKFGEDE